MAEIRSKYTHQEFQYACFELGGLEFGMDIKSVKEIVRYKGCEPSEGLPAFVEGTVRVRSVDVPVVDLAKRFSLDSGDDPERLIVASLGGRITGLAVDGVKDIITGGKELKTEDEGSREPWAKFVECVLETGKGKVRIVDLGKLFTDEELQALGSDLSGK